MTGLVYVRQPAILAHLSSSALPWSARTSSSPRAHPVADISACVLFRDILGQSADDLCSVELKLRGIEKLVPEMEE
jgi:hypothetical protein